MYSNLASVSVSTPFSADVDVLPTIQTGIKSSFPNEFSGKDVAKVVSFKAHSASAFTVKFNASTVLQAELRSAGDYVLKYVGFIDRVVFSASTILTQCTVGYTVGNQETFALTFTTVPASRTVTLKDGYGNDVDVDSSGVFHVKGGVYDIHIDSYQQYLAYDKRIVVTSDMTMTLNMSLRKYNVVFNLTPQTATVVLKDSNNVVVPQEDVDTYYIPNGTYTYVVSAGDPYIDKSGSITVNGEDLSQTVTLTELDSISITTPPTKTAYTVGESFNTTGMVVKANYKDSTSSTITTYTYEPSGALATTDTKVTVSYLEGSVTKTADQSITVTE